MICASGQGGLGAHFRTAVVSDNNSLVAHVRDPLAKTRSFEATSGLSSVQHFLNAAWSHVSRICVR
jgi:hypothetical protein